MNFRAVKMNLDDWISTTEETLPLRGMNVGYRREARIAVEMYEDAWTIFSVLRNEMAKAKFCKGRFV